MNIQSRLNPLIKEWPLIAIILVGFAMRIFHLTTQSLWLDELHTLNEAAPSMSWEEMFFYLKCCDQHPPLLFVIDKILFSVFGHTEFTARFIGVIAGTASIWAMYFLGTVLLNKRLGLIAAALTCINFFNLSYSQEARPYILAFLFAALSFSFLVKLIKAPSRKYALLYALFTLLLIYSHYYGLFIVVSQGILALIFIFQEKGSDRRRLLTLFLLAGAIIAVAYLPWLSHLAAMTRIKSFWIQPIAPDFLQNFFYEYFGNAGMLKPLLLLLLLIYVVRVTMEGGDVDKIRTNPLLLSFTIIVIWVFITVLIPYVRSVLVVPMLFPRYTIVILPGIILALSYGIELFRKALLKYVVLILFVVLSLIHLGVERRYYTATSKTQFREMTKFVVAGNSSNFPIVNERTAWHQQYYLKRFGSTAEVLTGKKESIIDSILAARTGKYSLRGFWLVGAHGDSKPDENTLKHLDTAYQLVKEQEFFDAWARLYVSKKAAGDKFTVIRFDQFDGGTIFPKEEYVGLWNGSIHSRPVALPPGNYKVSIRAWGDPAVGVFPHVNVYVNDKKLGDYFLSGTVGEKSFSCTTDRDMVVFKIEMDNDFFEPGKGDRNAFVKDILVEKLE